MQQSYIATRGYRNKYSISSCGNGDSDQHVNARVHVSYSPFAFRLSEYCTKFKSKFLKSCTAKTRTLDRTLTNWQLSSDKSPYALIKPNFPLRSLFVSKCRTTSVSLGSRNLLRIRWLNATSRIAYILMTNVQSLSSTCRECKNAGSRPTLSCNHALNLLAISEDSVGSLVRECTTGTLPIFNPASDFALDSLPFGILAMPKVTLNLALLFVFQLAAVQFFFWHRENLLHRFFEFLGRLLLGRCRHGGKVNAENLFNQTAFEQISASFVFHVPHWNVEFTRTLNEIGSF